MRVDANRRKGKKMIDAKTQKALKHMTVKQSRRWRLKLAGYSNSEIAKVEGISAEAVHYSLRDGKKRAKKRMKNLILT